jgi:anti-sigma regulatory factor (Ser/Thr protein kinase)
VVEPSTLVDRLLEKLLDGEEQEDDVCVLAVARTAPELRFAHAFPATPAAVAQMRRALAAWLEDVDIDPMRRRDAILAASEAAANAAEHAYSFDGISLVRVDAWVSQGRLQITVRDEGRWREPKARTDRGRGSMIISALMPDVAVDFQRGGTVVRMSLPVHEGGPA